MCARVDPPQTHAHPDADFHPPRTPLSFHFFLKILSCLKNLKILEVLKLLNSL